MARVADYSAGKPGARALRDAGFVGAVRYIGQPGWTKNTSAAELADFQAHGLGMGLVFELGAGDWRGGFTAGARHARDARAHADAIGFPRNRPIYMAIDQDVVTIAEFEMAMAYLDGAASVLGKERTGPYGEHDVCAWSWDRGYRWQWQCRAWSGTPIRHFAQRRLYQYFGHPESGPGGGAGPNIHVGGVEVDTNEVTHPDWGQHNGRNDMEFTDRVKLVSPGDPNHAEEHPLNYAVENSFYKSSDAYRALFGVDGEGGGLLDQFTELVNDHRSVKAENAELRERLGKVETGGISEERIGEIAINAVDEKLG